MYCCRTSIQRNAKGPGKLLRYIEGSLYRKPRFNEFAEKKPKCSLCRGMVNIAFKVPQESEQLR